MSIRGILFDLDNTLTDRGKSIDAFAVELVKDFSIDVSQTSIDRIRQTIKVLDNFGYRLNRDMLLDIRELFPWKVKPDIRVLEKYWKDQTPKCTKPAEGLLETLGLLHEKGFKLGIITNGDTNMQSAKIHQLAIEKYLDAIVISESVNVRKPERAIFHLALQQLDIYAEEAVYVGDYPEVDIIGAASAGLTPVWVRGCCAWPEQYEIPEYRIDSLRELMAVISEISRV